MSRRTLGILCSIALGVGALGVATLAIRGWGAWQSPATTTRSHDRTPDPVNSAGVQNLPPVTTEEGDSLGWGGSAEHQPPPEPDADGQLPAELQELMEAAERRSTEDFVVALDRAVRESSGRDLFLQSLLLTRGIARDARRIDDIELALQRSSLDPLTARALILSLGRTGSPAAQEALLRWLDTSSLGMFRHDILEALHVAPIQTGHQWMAAYDEYLKKAEGRWPLFMTAPRASTGNPRVIEATLRCVSEAYPIELRRLAADILARESSPLAADPRLDAALRERLRDQFVSLLASGDEELRSSAARYLRFMDDREVVHALWDAYNGAADERLREVFGAAAAEHARTPGEVARVLGALRRETSSIVKQSLFLSMPNPDRLASTDRLAVCQAIARVAQMEADPSVRKQAVYVLRKYLDAAPDCLDWALIDPSPIVHELATKAIGEVADVEARREKARQRMKSLGIDPDAIPTSGDTRGNETPQDASHSK